MTDCNCNLDSPSSCYGELVSHPLHLPGTPLGNWTPLWNLHVHSKHTPDYRSASCPCPDRPAAAGVVDHASRSDEEKSSNRPTVLYALEDNLIKDILINRR
jgi:hypothetical protein